MTRREILRLGATVAAGAPLASIGDALGQASTAGRTLGRTGARVGLVSLGGEGVLRTNGREREAAAVIEAALEAGVRYCDSAPAYQQSQDYYGAVFRRLGARARDQVFLATKTHDRTRDGSLRLLDQSLRRLGTDRLDLWQLHDLRDASDLTAIFGRGGALEAVERAKADGRVRFVGITGHHDPNVLLEAMRRHAFDTVLLPVNAADAAFQPFLTTVIPEARRRGMGVIGMKVLGRGRLVGHAGVTAEQAMRYALSHDVDTVIVGCDDPVQLRANLGVGRGFIALDAAERQALERRIAPAARRIAYYKRDA